jgi:hypothetical protein
MKFKVFALIEGRFFARESVKTAYREKEESEDKVHLSFRQSVH